MPACLWTGQDFLASPARTVFWWGLWIGSAAAVLIWRVALPLWRSARYRLRVTAVVPEDSETVSVYMSSRRGARPRVEAGQFFTFRFLSGRGWSRAHPYSLSAAPNGRSLRITVKVAGDGGAAVRRLRPGIRVLVEGPYGRLSARARTREKVAFIGAGVGMTPLRALAEALDYAPENAVLLHRYSDGQPLFRGELEALTAERGLEVLWLPGRRRARGSWLGDGVGSADDLTALTYWVPDLAERDVYVCGPEPWAAEVRTSCESAGLPADRFHVESFGW